MDPPPDARPVCDEVSAVLSPLIGLLSKGSLRSGIELLIEVTSALPAMFARSSQVPHKSAVRQSDTARYFDIALELSDAPTAAAALLSAAQGDPLMRDSALAKKESLRSHVMLIKDVNSPAKVTVDQCNKLLGYITGTIAPCSPRISAMIRQYTKWTGSDFESSAHQYTDWAADSMNELMLRTLPAVKSYCASIPGEHYCTRPDPNGDCCHPHSMIARSSQWIDAIDPKKRVITLPLGHKWAWSRDWRPSHLGRDFADASNLGGWMSSVAAGPLINIPTIAQTGDPRRILLSDPQPHPVAVMRWAESMDKMAAHTKSRIEATQSAGPGSEFKYFSTWADAFSEL